MSVVTQAQAGNGPGRSLQLARCVLRVRSGEQAGLECVLEGDLLRIGKNQDNDLMLRDGTVSREHCELVRDEKGYLLRDLGSTNGTFIDGAEVREGYLREGSIIRAGRVELEVHIAAENIELAPSTRERFGELVGRDPAMREIFGLLERVSATDATLLVLGETGTGKDALARSVHGASRRKAGPFVAVDCGALVGSLIESELFGHEKGAFTGAVERRMGAFETAQRGTLLLDEIGELPLDMQPKLLRALETRRIRRVGGNAEIAVDLRVIAATNRNLLLEIERGKFRQDLYFRLSVVPLRLPPLRERRGDVAILAARLLARAKSEHAPDSPASTLQLDPPMLAALAAHDWPGNVRELRNVIERAAVLGPSALFALNPLHANAVAAPAVEEFDSELSYGQQRERLEADFERRYVRWLLARHGGNVSAAARAAGMDRKHLHKLAQKHGAK